MQPLKNTNLPPHYYFTADKATVNRKSNQAILLCIMHQGVRVALPVGAPLVYRSEMDKDDLQIVGGSAKELADSVLNTLQQKLEIKDTDLSFLVGGTCDGQYVVCNDFSSQIAERIGVSDSEFSVPISWDPAHFLNLATTDLREGKSCYKESSIHMKRFISRCNVFSSEMNIGKGYSTLRAVCEHFEMSARAPSTYAFQRFTSSAVSQWNAILSSYKTLVTTFHLLNPKSAADNDEELKYKITGQDFIFDLLFFIDIFQPLTATMTALQGLSVPIWKTPKYIDLLMDFYKNIEIRAVTGLPLLRKHLAGIRRMTFEGVDLLPGYLVSRETAWKGADSEGQNEPAPKRAKKSRAPKVTYEWTAREIEDCIAEADKFKLDLIASIKHRAGKSIHKVCSTLLQCVDFTSIYAMLTGALCRQKVPYSKINLAKFGASEFHSLVIHVSNLPQIVDTEDLIIDTVFSAEIHNKIKNSLASTV